jgi:colanic acid biosynthesis protein WcaH
LLDPAALSARNCEHRLTLQNGGRRTLAVNDMRDLTDDQLSYVVRYAPLVSIDLIIRDPEGRVLVALRRSEPAKNYYFVPGGRIRKNETIDAAFQRILQAETGLNFGFKQARLLGVFQHIYPTNRFEDKDYGTHYVVLAYEIVLREKPRITLDAQHESWRWMNEHELRTASQVHPFVRRYFAG